MATPLEVSATLMLYDVGKCGYYARGSRSATIATLNDVLGELDSFAAKTAVGLSEVVHPEETEKVYLLSVVRHDNGDFLVTTWNRHDDDGSIAYLDASSIGASPRIHETKFAAGDIPGYATYFWFLPANRIVATVSIGGRRLTRLAGLRNYVEGFLHSRAKWVVKEDGEILGYGPLDAQGRPQIGTIDPKKPIEAKVGFERKWRKVATEEVLQAWKNVRKIMRRQTLRCEIPEERDLLETLFAKIGLAEPGATPQQEFSFSYEVEFHPSSEDELRKTLEAHARERGIAPAWGRTGFKLTTGDSQDVIWSDQCDMKLARDLEVQRVQKTSVVLPSSLLDALVRLRPEVLKLASGE